MGDYAVMRGMLTYLKQGKLVISDPVLNQRNL